MNDERVIEVGFTMETDQETIIVPEDGGPNSEGSLLAHIRRLIDDEVRFREMPSGTIHRKKYSYVRQRNQRARLWLARVGTACLRAPVDRTPHGKYRRLANAPSLVTISP